MEEKTINDYQKTAQAIADVSIKAHQFVSGALDKQIRKLLLKLSLVSGVVNCVPIGGIILYLLLLAYTFRKISKISGISFNGDKKAILKTVGTSILIYFIVDIIAYLVIIATGGLTYITAFLIGFFALYLIALSYIKALKLLFKERSKIDVNIKGGIENISNNTQDTVTQRITSTLNVVNNVASSTKQVNSLIDKVSNNGSEELSDEN